MPLLCGAAAGLPGLRPHRLRHTYATRLRQGGADPAQVQALLGYSSLDTTARVLPGRLRRTGSHRRARLRVGSVGPADHNLRGSYGGAINLYDVVLYLVRSTSGCRRGQ
ncbi:tyrosine-type recombinase/integrase [Planosporangium sp. 12N6]|uniref:tyrosine-type recombinase/integrase n=1 Tax=Planosporangium spinosum TaxID=3402278 RepID=UPI003CECCF42